MVRKMETPRILRFISTATNSDAMTTPGTYNALNLKVFVRALQVRRVVEKGEVIAHPSPGGRCQQVPVGRGSSPGSPGSSRARRRPARSAWASSITQNQNFSRPSGFNPYSMLISLYLSPTRSRRG